MMTLRSRSAACRGLAGLGTRDSSRFNSTFASLLGMSRYSRQEDAQAFVESVLNKRPKMKALMGTDPIRCWPVLNFINQPSGDWLVEFTPEQAAANVVEHFLAGGSRQMVGMKRVSVKRITDDQAAKRIAQLVAKVAVPIAQDNSTTPPSSSPSTSPSSVVAAMPFDARTLRVMKVPFHFGVEEVEYIFKDFNLAKPYGVGTLVDPEVTEDPFLVRFASTDECARAFRELNNTTIGKHSILTFIRFKD
mmetsp:Transcript_9237/g.15676  ORF Transcript_9237/g.15676 Transcript_9237/m.15676 type:complete len:248 (+) Transcript_9237:3-746(+)